MDQFGFHPSQIPEGIQKKPTGLGGTFVRVGGFFCPSRGTLEALHLPLTRAAQTVCDVREILSLLSQDSPDAPRSFLSDRDQVFQNFSEL